MAPVNDRSDFLNDYHVSDDEENPTPNVEEGISTAVTSKGGGLIHKLHHGHNHQHSELKPHPADFRSVSQAHLHHHHHQASHHNHITYTGHNLGFLMLLDGIGLAVITTATILEGYDFWGDLFSDHWSENSFGLTCWLAGRTCQIIGLVFLIGHASSFQVYPDIERFGMLMLTVGPILNLSSYAMFRSADNPTWWHNRMWLSSETLELIGIGILDVSLIDMEEIFVLVAEVVGFLFLMCAAALHFDFDPIALVPDVSLRLDVAHSSEVIGLAMLIVVAVCQYRIKAEKHAQEATRGVLHTRPLS